ncbi:MAG TPA: FmdB family zinc ribbon protein [Candidatus Wujingus californicus]|uniref:FmdB family zinc ribbon protein n=1 Tax=Candidatus Wujingus californicus TaxID=3367618 RepID=UPI001D9F57BD|nr:zinc ribbon domain-containing protein [Planctomycetota bacterium]
MPVYEFKCNQCNAIFDEYFRSTKERKKLFCPSCQSDHIHKIFSVFGMSVGGSGNDTASQGNSGGCGSCTATTCTGCR